MEPRFEARVARRYWSCARCGQRWDRTLTKCRTDGCTGRKPKPRVPKHAHTLRDDTYEEYCRVAELIHGVTDEACCVCGKPRSQERRHDRDHGHNRTELSYGRPRGLACVHCNKHMPVGLTLELARLVAAYLERVETHYTEEAKAA